MILRSSFTLLAVVLMLGFGIFFGVEVATRGMERIQGPIERPAVTTGISYGAVGTPGAAGTAQVQGGRQSGGAAGLGGTAQASGERPPASAVSREPLQGQGGAAAASNGGAAAGLEPGPVLHGDSGVNRLGNRIGDLLQVTARQTIATVVGIFDGIIQ